LKRAAGFQLLAARKRQARANVIIAAGFRLPVSGKRQIFDKTQPPAEIISLKRNRLAARSS
jgi:hypothetical protein